MPSTAVQLDRWNELVDASGGKAVTHMFLLGFDNQPSALVAQAIGRDRSNMGVTTLYYNIEAVVHNLMNAVRFPDSLTNKEKTGFFDRKLTMVQADLKMATEIRDLFMTENAARITNRINDLENRLTSLTDKEHKELSGLRDDLVRRDETVSPLEESTRPR